MLFTIVLLGWTLVAAATDVLLNKIYNWNTYSGILAGLILSAVGQALPWIGSPAFLDSLGGLLLCGGLMVVCFAIFPGIGGGDVKLVAMIGAMLGCNQGLEALLWTFVLAAVFGVIGLIWQIGPVAGLSRVARFVGGKFRLPWFLPLSDEERTVLKPPHVIAPSALVAVIIVRFGLIT
jgi:prepilin peptidase CpaA